MPRSATTAASDPNVRSPIDPEHQANGHDEQREAEAELPQQAAGQQPLQAERDHARVEVEPAEERRQLVAAGRWPMAGRSP